MNTKLLINLQIIMIYYNYNNHYYNLYRVLTKCQVLSKYHIISFSQHPYELYDVVNHIYK